MKKKKAAPVAAPQPAAPAVPAWKRIPFKQLLGLAAVALAVIAFRLAPRHGMAALAGYAAAAALLLFATREGRGTGLLPAQPFPLEKWELAFVPLLILGAAALRFYKLGDVPGFALDYEGYIANSAKVMDGGPYRAYDTLPPVEGCWPTVVHYQTLAFGKLFGWTAGVLRAPNAIYGVLACAALYFTARRLSSPGPAALAAALFAASSMPFIMSRRIYVVIPLAFFLMTMLYFHLEGLRRGRWFYYAAAGFSAGMLMNYYQSGRVVLGIVPAWWLWMLLFDRGSLPKLRHIAVFLAFAFLAFLPLYLFSRTDPGAYWAWMASIDPNRGRGIAGYLGGLKLVIPFYMKIFSVSGDPHIQDSVPLRPIFDPASGGLLAVGAFLCAATLWRAASSWLLIAFCAGMMPALLGGLFPHPVPRRAIMAMPVAFLMVGLAADRFRLALNPAGRAWRSALFALLGAAAVAFSARATWRHYLEFSAQPVARIYHHGDVYEAAKEMAAHPEARARFSKTLTNYAHQRSVFFPRKADFDVFRGSEEMLAYLGDGSQLIFLEPYAWGLKPLILAAFPKAEIKEAGWDGKPPKPEDPYYSNFVAPDGPMGLLMSVFVPEADAASLHGLVDKDSGSRVPAFSPGYGASAAGRRLRLAGTLLAAHVEGGAPVVSLPLPGFSLKVDGRPAALGSPLPVKAGPVGIELEGRLPAGFAGPLPLRIHQAGLDLMAHKRLIALELPYGFRAEARDGILDDKGRLTRLPRQLAAARRFYDDEQGAPRLVLPYTYILKARLSVPATGAYQFRFESGIGRIRLDGREVFRNFPAPGAPLGAYLEAGKPAELSIEAIVPSSGEGHRVFAVGCQAPGQEGFQPIPLEWTRPD